MHKEKTAFSVLMSVYAKDKASCLKEALDSVINQTRPPDEIIMVADGPVPRDIADILESYKKTAPALKVFYHPVNEGLGPALAQGLGYSSHNLIARMDSDDICVPDRFEKQLACFAQDDNLSIIGGQIEEFDAKSLKTIARRNVPLTDAAIKERLKSRSPFNHPSVMFKKADVLAAGGYRPFHLFEDYDLWMRMSARGLKMRNLPDVLLRMRVDSSLYARRGGWKYFKSNKAAQDELLKLKIISFPRYLFNITGRFTAQVLMPNRVREIFYKTFLR